MFVALSRPIYKASAVEWQAIRRIAHKVEPKLQAAFASAVQQLRSAISLTDIFNAMADGSIEELVVRQAPYDVKDFAVAVTQALVSGGQSAASHLGPRLKARLGFDVTNPKAREWAESHAGDLITRINDDTRQSIRTIISNSLDASWTNLTPHDQARLVYEQIGLTPRYARAVQTSFRTRLSEGAPRAIALAAAKRYAEKLRHHRAVTIARHEALMAANRGQELLWEQAVQQDYLSPDVQREWITTPDDRRCPLCAPMHGKTTPIGQPWQTPTGSVMTPTEIHVQCRCAEGLKINTIAAGPAALDVKPSGVPKLVEPPSSSGVILPRPPQAMFAWPLKDTDIRRRSFADGNALVAAISGHQDAWYRDLSHEEKASFLRYSGSDYRGINAYLRTGAINRDDDPTDVIYRPTAQRLIAAMKRAPTLPEPVLVWRGLTGSAADQIARLEQIAPGGFVTLSGFQSASIRPGFAQEWSTKRSRDGAVLEILTRRGVILGGRLSSQSHEVEMLLPHHARYRLRGVKTSRYRWQDETVSRRTIQLELVED